jgi:hypothetical protein
MWFLLIFMVSTLVLIGKVIFRWDESVFLIEVRLQSEFPCFDFPIIKIQSRDLILMDVCQSLRPFCRIKFIPAYPYSANQYVANEKYVTFLQKHLSKKA